VSVLSQKIRTLILPPRPDPAQSRRIAEGRLLICGLFALAIFGSIGARIIVLADTNVSKSIAPSANAVSVERGRILDRNGKLLAGNLPITLLHADPSEIMNVNDAAKQLAALLPNQSAGNLKTLLSKETRYVELERQLSPKRHSQILELGIPGVYFADSQTRVYPQALTAAHILGYVDTDNKGIA
jgi:cell division protein FtsI (penicillin-binding protein 3)